MDKNPGDKTDESALEEASLQNEANSNSLESDSLEQPEEPKTAPAETKKPRLVAKLRQFIEGLNVYLLLFLFILALGGMVTFIGVQQARQQSSTPNINTTSLTPEELEALRSSGATVGDPKQTLTIESNAVFSGRVLVRDNLDVAGTIQVGGSLNLPGITVSGTSEFDQIQANNLAISGDVGIQGALNIQGNLTVGGGATFGGPISAPQLTTQNLQLAGDLTVSRHIDAGGGTPSRTNGNALGSGGTSSISGTDTAGTVTVNIGSGAPAAGCFASISFAQAFSGTPHVVITPVGSGGARLSYYVTRSASGFQICHNSTFVPSGSFSFDYIVID